MPAKHDHPRVDLMVDGVRISKAEQTGEFDYRWPEMVEHYPQGWQFRVEVDGHSRRLRHAIGIRDAFGRPRVRSVTWVDGYPTVEGVEPEDYSRSHCTVSLLRPAGSNTLVREFRDVPSGYDGFCVIEFASEVRGPNVPRGLAVKIPIDDLAAWARHALIRDAGKRRSTASVPPRGLTTAASLGPSVEATGGVIPSPVDGHATKAVVEALLAYQGHLAEARGSRLPHFVTDPDANRLVIEDPFAFLLAVICDQGVPAERAWRVPHDLRRRLGHLDAARMAADGVAVQRAFTEPPVLHRFPNMIAPWIVSASRRVTQHYAGDAGRIWSGAPTARELQQRLDEFLGIGQKKSAMAVEILERELRIPIARLAGSDVAFDVHLRRTMLRTGLAERDEVGHMVEAARRHHPERPGALDNPLWEIGRRWCHARTPGCASCAISNACPKFVSRGDGVRGI